MATKKLLIDAYELREILDADECIWFGNSAYFPNWQINACIASCHTVDAVEVVHGYWLYYSTTMQECSNCHRHTARHKFKYCPHCGAVMEDKYHESAD